MIVYQIICTDDYDQFAMETCSTPEIAQELIDSKIENFYSDYLEWTASSEYQDVIEDMTSSLDGTFGTYSDLYGYNYSIKEIKVVTE